MMINKSVFIVLLLALLIRLPTFGKVPYGLNRDEAGIGYNAYLISQTGKDEYGRQLPLQFESFGDWKQSVYIYTTVPVVALMGLNEVSVRLVGLVSGLILTYLVYELVLLVIGKEDKQARLAGIVAALVMAFNPWHFHFSHLGLESMLATSMMVGGLALLFSKKKKMGQVYAGLGLWSLAVFTYHGSLVMVPIMLGLYILHEGKQIIKNKRSWFSLGVTLLIVGWQVYASLFGASVVKSQGTTIFNMTNEEKYNQIYQYRDGTFVSKLKHNRYGYLAKTFITNYKLSWGLEFLVRKGASHNHYNVPGYGNFYGWELGLAAIGLLSAIGNWSRKKWFLLGVLLASVVPAAITIQQVHSVRSLVMLPTMMTFVGIGSYELIIRLKNSKWKLVLGLVLGAVYLVSGIRFVEYYQHQYSRSSDAFYTGYMREVSWYMSDVRSDYDQLVVTYPFESPYIFDAFYNRMDPKIFLTTIERFPIDALGFKHIKGLNGVEYVISNSEVIDGYNLPGTNRLIFSRVEELPQGVKPIITWSNLEGKIEIVAWNERQLGEL